MQVLIVTESASDTPFVCVCGGGGGVCALLCVVVILSMCIVFHWALSSALYCTFCLICLLGLFCFLVFVISGVIV